MQHPDVGDRSHSPAPSEAGAAVRAAGVFRAVALCCLMVAASPAQNPLSSLTERPAEPAVDPLGRDTPRRALLGFLAAAQAGRTAEAAQYLQLAAPERGPRAEKLADELAFLMDRGFLGGLERVSDRPEGSLADDPDPGRERVGTIAVDGQSLDVVLARVDQPPAGRLWLIAAETLRQVPHVYGQVELPQIEERLPGWLAGRRWLRIPLWKWLTAALLLPVAFGCAWVIAGFFVVPWRLVSRWRRGQPGGGGWNLAGGPVLVILAMIVHYGFVSALRVPLVYRFYYDRAVQVAIAVGFGWLLWRLIDVLVERAQLRASGATRAARSFLMLGRRILKALLAGAVVLAILALFGVETRTALAGLGIGGIAVALAAQKTIENLFGGVSMLGDRVIRVGDVCRFGDRIGEVTDIGLRSTRVRTLERTELSIPNGVLATINIENLALRDRFLFQTRLGVRYETTAEQLRALLADLRRLLHEHPKVVSDSFWVRLVGFGASSIDIEVFSHIDTRDFQEFAAVREDLLLCFLDAIEGNGSGLAFPSQTLYMTRDAGLDPARARAGVQRGRAGTERREKPLPDMRPPAPESP